MAAFLLPLFINPLALADPFEPGKVRLFQFIVLMMAAAALWPNEKKIHWFRGNPLVLPVMAYGMIVILATAVSIDIRLSVFGPGNRHGTITILTTLLFFFLLTAVLDHQQQVDDLINVILISSVPVTLYGLIQYLGLDPIIWKHDSISPIHATLGRSLYLGGYLAMVMPFMIIRFIQYYSAGQRKRQIAFGIVLLLQLSCLLLTLARGAWLGLLGGLVFFVLLMTFRQRTKIWLVLCLVVAGLIMLGFISRSGWTILGEAAPFSGDLGRVRESSDQYRLVTWGDALALFPDRWLFGYGPETFATAVEQRLDVTTGKDTSHLPDPHNLLLYQVTAVGLAGLLAFLWIIGRFYALLLTRFRQTNEADTRLLLAAILSSTTAYLIQAQFNPDVITLSVLFWINLSAGITLLRQKETTYASNEASIN